MTTGPQDAVAAAARRRTVTTAADGDPEERADLEADRRRQRELDDGELGGEA